MRFSWTAMLALAGLLVACAIQAQPNASAPSSATDKDVLVGVNYFAGWWQPQPNKWHGADGEDWRPNYPNRIALLGQYNDQETMDREIVLASAYGVDFFPILWYYNDPGSEREPNARFLERGLTNFMASPEAHRMKFFIEYCNHPPYEVETDEQWQDCLDTWLKAFAHPSYMRVGGKLVFKIHGWGFFWNQCGQDRELCRVRIDSIRDAVREAGLGEMLIGCGVGAQEKVTAAYEFEGMVDFTATYMDLPQVERTDQDYPYEMLRDFGHKGRLGHNADAVAYLPYLPAGWSPKPWPDRRAYFELPRADQWEIALRQMAGDLEKNDNLGLPLPGGGRQKMFTIYAWNEFGEGGFVAPTYGDGLMKLQAIKNVFGTR